MRHDLNKDFSNNDDGNQLYAELVTQGYVVSNEINYRSYGDLTGIQLSEELVKYKEALVGKCNKIGELFTRFRDYSDLQNSYSVMVRELKTSIQENELLGGMTGVVAGEVAQKVVPPMMKKVGEFFKKTQQERQSEHYEEAGDNSKEKAKSKKGRTKVDQNKIAQQTGLNRKPATGKNPEPQPEEGTQGSNGNPGMAEARGETRTARENNLFATRDATGKAAGSRDGFTAMDIPENMELIAHQRIVRFDGKEYLILAQSKRTFSNEGIPLAEDTYFESFEIKGTEQIGDGILLGNTLGSTDPFGKILRESLHISHDLINNVQNIEHRNFMGEGVGSLLNPEMGIWVGKLDMKTPVNPEVVYIKRPQFPALPDKASQNVPPQNKLPQNELNNEVSKGQEKLIGQVLGGEKKGREIWELAQSQSMLESGVMSLEGARLMNDLFTSVVLPKVAKFVTKTLSNPKVQGSLEIADGVGEILVGLGIAGGTGLSIVGFAGGVVIICHGASQASKGFTKIWTNNREIESLTAIAMQQLGVPKNVANTIDDMTVIVATGGGAIIARKITEATAEQAIKEAIKEGVESIPMGSKTKISPKDTKLANKADLKPDIDVEDLTHPSTPVGHKQREIRVQDGTNSRTIINNREYSGHALDRMQERGLTPTMVEHVIENGIQSPGNVPNRILHYDPENKVTVVTGDDKVITVIFGGAKK